VAPESVPGGAAEAFAHEVNQPLMSIAANAGAALRWLRRGAAGVDQVEALLREILGQSERAGAIVHALRLPSALLLPAAMPKRKRAAASRPVPGARSAAVLSLHHRNRRKHLLARRKNQGARMKPVVYVVDDDDAVRASVLNLLGAEGYAARGFAAAGPFFEEDSPDGPACLICDMRMPGLGGLEVAAELGRLGRRLPIIFMTGFGSIPLSVQAMKAGATEFLTKPVQPDELLRAVADALAADEAQLAARRELTELRQRHARLTPRERETMSLVIGGLLNKQVADALGVSEIMAKIHKRKVMEKMAARSLPDLVRHAERLQIEKSRSR